MSLEIANTIWKQICAGGKIKVMSWGVPLDSRAGEDTKTGGYLQFKVNGMKFKGIVKVIYKYDDYTIQFIKVKNKKDELSGLKIPEFITEHEVAGVYGDQLTEIIDEYVEKVPAYKF